MDKVIRLGVGSHSNIYCRIKYDGKRLSITGVEGPYSNGNCGGGAGQIVMRLLGNEKRIDPAPGWDTEKIKMFLELWDRWHLNDMRAGSQVQENWLREHPISKEEYAYPKSYYEVASQWLTAAGLNPDADGYKYGHAWKFEAVPEWVICFFQGLPDTDMKPAWI